MHRPPAPAARRRMVLGVDLGQRRTPATLVAVEVRDGEPAWDAVRYGWVAGLEGRVAVLRLVESLPLGTSYTEVARRVWRVAEQVDAQEIWVDASGLGNPVMEIFQQRRPAGLRCGLRPVVITPGREAHEGNVPRNVLLMRLAVEWQEGRVKVAAGLAGWEEVRRELLALDGNGRKRRERDDLAMALALAIWGLAGEKGVAGERGEGRLV